MSSYNDFALFYDRFTTDVDYSARTDYLCEIFKKYDKMPTLLLDVACGTGNFSLEFARRGVSVIGTDISEDMLSCAREKSSNENADILFLCQAAQDLDLYGTVDGAVSCLDSINHITNYNTLKKALKKISLFLEKDRLFIFDVNTEYKQECVLGDNTFVLEEQDVFCVWQNEYDKRQKTTYINIDFFENKGNNSYKRYSENFCERVYSDEQLINALTAAGLRVEKIFGENSFKKPTKNTTRKIFVARKV